MSYKSKYYKGEKIVSLDELSKQDFIYYRDRIYHYGWFASWQYRMIENAVKAGQIFYAIKKPKIKYPFTTTKEQVKEHTFFVAKSKVLKGCIGQGDTLDEAIIELAENEAFLLEFAEEFELQIPTEAENK